MNTTEQNWRKLWDELSNIPVNDNEQIEESFLDFPIGTETTEIWHWFEEKFNISLGDEMYS